MRIASGGLPGSTTHPCGQTVCSSSPASPMHSLETAISNSRLSFGPCLGPQVITGMKAGEERVAPLTFPTDGEAAANIARGVVRRMQRQQGRARGQGRRGNMLQWAQSRTACAALRSAAMRHAARLAPSTAYRHTVPVAPLVTPPPPCRGLPARDAAWCGGERESQDDRALLL